MNENKILNIIEKSVQVISKCDSLVEELGNTSKEIISCLSNKKKIIIFGNGGSAADAQHMAAEFIGRYQLEGISLPAIALTTDTSILTAIGNDYGFENIFARQCESLVNQGDIIIAISTSGNSKNILAGVQRGKEMGAKVIGLTGSDGGLLKENLDIAITVPSRDTPRIQEGHRVLIHIICEIVEKHFRG